MNYMSDHNPILLVFGTNNDFREDSRPKVHIKRFKNGWIQEQACYQIVKETWRHTSGGIPNKLQSVMERTHNWGKTNYGHIPRKIKEIQTMIHKLKSLTPTSDEITQMHPLESNLDNLLIKEEQWWAQRAKINWLLHGDKNCKFFHFKAS
jgi:hypothetical protein